MAARYEWLNARNMAAIPIGGDPDDFAALRARPARGGDVELDLSMINLSYVGSFLPRAAPLVERLLGAVADLRSQTPELAARLRLNFIGTSNQPDGTGGGRVTPYAEAAGVADLVQEVPRRIPYLEALGVLANSNGLLLIGSDEPHYTASKIYPALLSGRPYLSLFHVASSAHAILSSAGGGRAIGFTDAGDLQASTPAILEGLRDLAFSPQALGAGNLEVIQPYTAGGVAAQFAEVFARVLRS
jgi:hypothetical protein